MYGNLQNYLNIHYDVFSYLNRVLRLYFLTHIHIQRQSVKRNYPGIQTFDSRSWQAFSICRAASSLRLSSASDCKLAKISSVVK